MFLHGGVNNPAFRDTSHIKDPDFLFEGNKTFAASALNNGFDVLVPVVNDSLNWLTGHQQCFRLIRDYLDTKKSYSTRYISGFSDGGTGSYKIFYDNPDYFDGLAVFNGYPQHKNFNKRVNYGETGNKRIVFFSTCDDNIIPYEFLLTEYCKQKESNPNTYFYVTDGDHAFDAYGKKECEICFDILTSRITNANTEPIHAFVANDTVIEFYRFRKKVFRKFHFGEDYLLINQKQEKKFNK